MELGVTILPSAMLEAELRLSAISRIYFSDFSFQNTVHLAWHQSKFLSPVMQDFVQMARELCHPTIFPLKIPRKSPLIHSLFL
ncbi:MAG: LysR substrate-binding domain-containing protein [Clostridium fessum]